jgi:hypothetical protein
MGKAVVLRALTVEERQTLKQLARFCTGKARLVEWIPLLLALADGHPQRHC